MASAAAGGNGGGGGGGGGGGKQSSTGLLSAMASLNPFGKSKAGGKGANSSSNRGSRGSHSNETVPRSYDLNGVLVGSSSDHGTEGGGRGGDQQQQQPMQGSGGATRRSSESALGQAGGDGESETLAGGGQYSVGVAEGNSPPVTNMADASAAAAAVGDLKEATVDEDSPSTLYAGRETDIELGFPAAHIIGYWKEKEEKKFTRRMNDSRKPPPDYVTHRRFMVDWLSEVGEQLDLQTVTIHSAVSFLDELMMLTDYVTRDWQLYAVCCLSVAAKYEEAECNMPMISELADAAEISLTTPIVTRGELDLVQNRLQWDVSRVTAMHFLGYYTSQGVTMPDDTCQGRRLVEKVVTYMNKYVDFFANLCQQDYQFQRYRPSHIAAAAVLAARRALCIKPLWRDELTELTGYTVEDIVECGEELWNLYEEMFPSHRPLRTDASAALKKAAAAEQQEQQASGLASSADPHAPSSGSNPTMVVGNASGSAGGGVAVSGEDDSRTGYDASTA